LNHIIFSICNVVFTMLLYIFIHIHFSYSINNLVTLILVLEFIFFFFSFFLFFSFFFFFFFFFSSRRRHTRSDRDWSSDVCSSDLQLVAQSGGADHLLHLAAQHAEIEPAVLAERRPRGALAPIAPQHQAADRSEERRVGKECRSRWAREQKKKKIENK